MVDIPFYGGPQEGGWWGVDTEVVAYHECISEEEANRLKDEVEKLAQELNAEARKTYGEQCLREMELEERGHVLPEPDGPEEYKIVICQTVPEAQRGNRVWS